MNLLLNVNLSLISSENDIDADDRSLSIYGIVNGIESFRQYLDKPFKSQRSA